VVKKIKKVSFILLILLIGIQFYRPNKNIQKETTLDDFLTTQKAQKPIKILFQNSCYNCHSNSTDYYWYDNIAPASWIVDRHIKKSQGEAQFF